MQKKKNRKFEKKESSNVATKLKNKNKQVRMVIESLLKNEKRNQYFFV